jgi:hypothetical protein
MNQDLQHDKYVLPDELKDQLNININKMGSGDKGYSRIKTILGDGHINYGQAKKFKHELENNLEGDDYENVCGDDMLLFIDNCLNKRRESIKSGKTSRMNAGMENQFKKSHTKDKTKNPTNVRQVKVAKDSKDIFTNRAVYEEIAKIKKLLK